VDIGAALAPNPQASMPVKPGGRALDHPAAAAEARAVGSSGQATLALILRRRSARRASREW
jgi:hypothetical protein